MARVMEKDLGVGGVGIWEDGAVRMMEGGGLQISVLW